MNSGMKLMSLTALFVASVVSIHAKADDLSNEFKITCDVQLIGVAANPLAVRFESKPAVVTAGPDVTVDLGKYTLSASGSYSGATDSKMEPRLEVAIFKKGKGPISGQINLAGATGLVNAAIGQSISTYSRSFLNITYKGTAYTRIDYSCAMARVK